VPVSFSLRGESARFLAAARATMCCRVPSKGISFLAICGLTVALYALYVELQLADDPYYVAACDVGGMSCTVRRRRRRRCHVVFAVLVFAGCLRSTSWLVLLVVVAVCLGAEEWS
jgi:hypothetical protein